MRVCNNKGAKMSDTIAAISTAYGEGGIGIIRISGDDSLNILNKIFKTKSKIKDRQLTYGHIINPESEEIIDEVLAIYMKAPHTYTTEDVVEINCHGSIVSLRKTLAICYLEGARPAEEGEFTKRAFLGGRLDLSQAEAVIDLIRAKTDKGFDIAIGQLEGRLSRKIKEIRAEILDILVNITVNIDYPDEDIDVIVYNDLEKNIRTIKCGILDLINSSGTGRILKEGLRVSIIGKPNVGKSSLMNALLQESRAIVTEIPGTTRDTISETINLEGIPIVLTDTAGIRDTNNEIEQIGIERSKQSFNDADFVIYMVDASVPLTEEDMEIANLMGKRPGIVLLNKQDLPGVTGSAEIKKILPNYDLIPTSIAREEGISKLKEAILNQVFQGKTYQKNSLAVTNERHVNLLKTALSHIEDSLKSVKQKEPLEIIEIDIDLSYSLLGEIIGETVTDDVLDEVFSRFCLGK